MKSRSSNGRTSIAMPTVLTNHICIVLDKSGSMAKVAEETVSAFNEQLQTIQRESHAKGQITTVSLTTFNDSVYFDIDMVDAYNVKPLKVEAYRPSGMTSLRDAVGFSINRLMCNARDINEPDTSVLFVIISDGLENNSKVISQERLAKIIQELQNTGRWTFTYLGANQDLSKVQKDYALSPGNVSAFANTHDGVIDASVRTSTGLTNYFASRSVGLTATNSFYGDTEKVGT